MALLFGFLGIFSNVSLLDATVAVAQDEDGGGDEKAAPADDAGGGQAATPPETKTYAAWVYGALGWFYSAVFLGLSFSLVALFIMNLLAIRHETVIPTPWLRISTSYSRRRNIRTPSKWPAPTNRSSARFSPPAWPS